MSAQRLKSLLVLVSLMASATGVLAPSIAFAAPTKLRYVLSAHPDDEYSVWSMIRNSPTYYKVIIYLTWGEEAGHCDNNDGLEGPNSEGEPNWGEIDPNLGTGLGPPWAGKWSDECKWGRIRSTLTYLDAQAALDPNTPTSIPTGFTQILDDDEPYTWSGQTSAGLPPEYEDYLGVPWIDRSAFVYEAANGMGTVIFFNLGDGDLKKEEVQWAVGKVTQLVTHLSIPNLPTHDMVAPYSATVPPSNCTTAAYPHPDHAAVRQAMLSYDMTGGRPQRTRTCSQDPEGSTTLTIPTAEFNANKSGHLSARNGPFQIRYGWLVDNHWNAGWWLPDYVFAQAQDFRVEFP